MADMSDSKNYAEYTVKQKAEGKYLTRRLLLILLYLAFAGAYSWFFLFGPVKIPMVIALLPVFVWMLVFFTWKFVQLEHKYEVVSAHIKFTELYGDKKEEVVFDELVSELELIAPLNDEYKAKAEGADTYIDCRGSKKSPDSYFLVLNKDGKKTVVYFEAITKALKVMTFYNKNATVVVDNLRV